MSGRPGIALLLALLELVAFAYFAFLAWRAPDFARALLHRGWDTKGWDEPRLALRLRLVGVGGAVLSAGAVTLAVLRALG